MPEALAEAVALLLLAITIAFVVARPRGWPEAVVAAPAAGLCVAIGALSPGAALHEVATLGPTVGFLAAVLVLGELCRGEGLFDAAGDLMARVSGGGPVGLLALVFVVAAAVTVVLSLDATVVLLTPVVLATAATLRLRPKPHVYACGHLANSASLLLPVSNLTNLIAFRASGLSFFGFGALMLLPWLVAIAVEWAVLRRWFAGDLAPVGEAPAPVAAPDPVSSSGSDPAPAPARDPDASSGRDFVPVSARHPATVPPRDPARRAPRVAIAVLALTLAGFALTSVLGAEPVYAAAAGAIALALYAVRAGRARPRDLARALSVPFLVFVLALGVVVRAADVNGLGRLAASLVPGGSSLASLLAVAALAALLANLVNNLPAILILLPAVTLAGRGSVLAALVGVNVGPNLTYVGSLATLLWRRALTRRGAAPDPGEFVRLGAVSVPAAVVAATVALWIGLRLWG